MATHIAASINSEECSSLSIKCSCRMCEKAIETLEILKTCICNECKQTDELISDQEMHANIHTSTCYQGNIYDKVSYVDNNCDKSVESTSLNQKNVCSTLRLFTCDKCDKSFKFNTYLRRHKKIHSPLKPYACDDCDKSFKFMDYLHKHKKVHSTLRPYACDTCDKYYKRKSYLIRHNKICHSTLKSYVRNNYKNNKSFKKTDVLQKDKNHFHPKFYVSDKCEQYELKLVEPKKNIYNLEFQNSDENEDQAVLQTNDSITNMDVNYLTENVDNEKLLNTFIAHHQNSNTDETYLQCNTNAYDVENEYNLSDEQLLIEENKVLQQFGDNLENAPSYVRELKSTAEAEKHLTDQSGQKKQRLLLDSDLVDKHYSVRQVEIDIRPQ